MGPTRPQAIGPTRWAGATRAAGILLASSLMLAQCAGAPGIAGGGPLPVIDPAVRTAAGAGQVRVIIELRMTPPFTPEGNLPGPAAVEAQREAIAKTQAALLARLAGTKFSISHQYDGLPLISLAIGADALARLDAAGDLVVRVLPDAKRFPQS